MSRNHLARFLETYFRHRWLNLVPLLMMIVIGAVWLATAKPQYLAAGTMYVQNDTLLATLTSNQPAPTGWTSAADTTAGEIKSLLQTEAFVRAVVQQSDLEPEMSNGPRVVEQTLNRVRSEVSVQSLGQNMVVISAIDTSPAVAQQLSAGVMQYYIQWRENTNRSDSAAAQTYFQNLIPTYQAALNTARQDLQAYLSQHPDPVRGSRPTDEQLQISWLEAAVQDATTRLNDAVTKAQDAQLANARASLTSQGTYSVIDAARVPVDPTTSRRQQALRMLVFVAAGLLLSLTAVLGAALFDTTLRFPADVQGRLDLPVLTAIPDIAPEPGSKEEQMIQTGQPVAVAQGA